MGKPVKVDHKRTFLYLEQLILKHNAHKDVSNIKETAGRIWIWFFQKSQSLRMGICRFLTSCRPSRYSTSEQLNFS